MENHSVESRYHPVSLAKLTPHSILNFDIFLRADRHYVLYRSRKIIITLDDIRRLVESGVDIVYIHEDDRKNFRDYMERNIETILKAADVPLEKKAEALYESAINVVEDVFANPRSGETIQRSREMVSHTVDFVLTGPAAFANLLKIRAHDFYTYTHSVNVCTFLVTLAQALGVQDKQTLREVGEGGMLHDLGKSRVPAAIINKNGPLDKEEWAVMRLHPQFGVEIARDTRDMSAIGLTIIGQHHEKLNGGGYPRGLQGGDLSVYARMASIVDVYDAVTTNRSYQKARSAVEAAQILLGKGPEFDERILRQFILMLAVKE